MSPMSDDKPVPAPRVEAREVVESPEPPSNQKKLHKRGKGPLEKRKSSPAITQGMTESKMKIGPRSSSQPVLVAFLPQYVNKLKGQPYSLKEKMTRWCKKSPYALIKKHLPPQDFYIEFPNVCYDDHMNDEFGRGIERLEREADDAANGVSTKPRVEIVLERYPAGRHDGVTCTFDPAPDNGDRFISAYGVSGGLPSKSSRRSEPQMTRHSPSLDMSNMPRNMNRPSSATSPTPASRRQSVPVLRVGTNTSLLPMGPPGREGSQEMIDLSMVRSRPSIDACFSAVTRPSMDPMSALPVHEEIATN